MHCLFDGGWPSSETGNISKDWEKDRRMLVSAMALPLSEQVLNNWGIQSLY